MLPTSISIFGKRGWLPGLVSLLTVLIIACGGSAQPPGDSSHRRSQSDRNA
jgi:hypothetical protein